MLGKKLNQQVYMRIIWLVIVYFEITIGKLWDDNSIRLYFIFYYYLMNTEIKQTAVEKSVSEDSNVIVNEIRQLLEEKKFNKASRILLELSIDLKREKIAKEVWDILQNEILEKMLQAYSDKVDRDGKGYFLAQQEVYADMEKIVKYADDFSDYITLLSQKRLGV